MATWGKEPEWIPPTRKTHQICHGKRKRRQDAILERTSAQTKQTYRPIRTTVYRTPSHTGQYLHYDFSDLHNVKVEVTKCLYDRARTICSNKWDRQEEFENIRRTLK